MKQTILKYSSLLALLGSTFFSTQTSAAIMYECATGTSPAVGCTIDVSDTTYTLTGDVSSTSLNNVIEFGFNANSNTLNFIGNVTTEGLDANAFVVGGGESNTLLINGNIITSGRSATGIWLNSVGGKTTTTLTGNISTSGTDAYGVYILTSNDNTT